MKSPYTLLIVAAVGWSSCSKPSDPRSSTAVTKEPLERATEAKQPEQTSARSTGSNPLEPAAGGSVDETADQQVEQRNLQTPTKPKQEPIQQPFDIEQSAKEDSCTNEPISVAKRWLDYIADTNIASLKTTIGVPFVGDWHFNGTSDAIDRCKPQEVDRYKTSFIDNSPVNAAVYCLTDNSLLGIDLRNIRNPKPYRSFSLEERRFSELSSRARKQLRKFKNDDDSFFSFRIWNQGSEHVGVILVRCSNVHGFVSYWSFHH